jgi:hypothetical protein
VAQRLQHCGKCIVLNSALAAEGALFGLGMSFSAASDAVPLPTFSAFERFSAMWLDWRSQTCNAEIF